MHVDGMLTTIVHECRVIEGPVQKLGKFEAVTACIVGAHGAIHVSGIINGELTRKLKWNQVPGVQEASV